MSEQEVSWKQLEKEKRLLLQEVVEEDLTEQQYEVFKEVLELEAKNRHLSRPHGMKKKTVQIIERIVK